LRVEIGAGIIDEDVHFPIATRNVFGKRLDTLMIVDL
jgi:hypothetical protein